MNRLFAPRGRILVLSLFLLVAAAARSQEAATEDRVPRFGEYRGYGEALYDGWSESSRCVTLREGTGLALDLFLPTREGEAATEKPVVRTHQRYHRSTRVGSTTFTATRAEER